MQQDRTARRALALHPIDNVTQVTALSQADEALRRARTAPVYRTEPLPAVAAAALNRLEQAFATTTKAVA